MAKIGKRLQRMNLSQYSFLDISTGFQTVVKTLDTAPVSTKALEITLGDTGIQLNLIFL